MISLWTILTEHDVEAYAATLVLPDYLAHLRLRPVRFMERGPNCNGREPLRLTYEGERRIEDFDLRPEEHAAGMIRHVCPGVDAARIRLPQIYNWEKGKTRPRQEQLAALVAVRGIGKREALAKLELLAAAEEKEKKTASKPRGKRKK